MKPDAWDACSLQNEPNDHRLAFTFRLETIQLKTLTFFLVHRHRPAILASLKFLRDDPHLWDTPRKRRFAGPARSRDRCHRERAPRKRCSAVPVTLGVRDQYDTDDVLRPTLAPKTQDDHELQGTASVRCTLLLWWDCIVTALPSRRD